jgi:phosphoribosylamine--glycine ligase
VVIKADGLAAGKGVTVAYDEETAIQAIDQAMNSKIFGSAGETLVIEQFLSGEEASILAFSDCKHVLPLTSSQDHKPVFDGDKGPNTGGMGAYSPAPVVTTNVENKIFEQILKPTIKTMFEEVFRSEAFYYEGLMIIEQDPLCNRVKCAIGRPRNASHSTTNGIRYCSSILGNN